MLVALTQLLFCQLAGEVIARAFDLAVPGPVIGMGLLLAILLYRSNVPEQLDSTATGILSHSCLFPPVLAWLHISAFWGMSGKQFWVHW
jgi:holin-like protein